MPDLKSNACVSFDRDLIRSKITQLSFKEARRTQGPIYDVLLKELLEEGCANTFKYIECLLKKEEKLIALNYTSHRLYHEPELLIAVVDNLKLAELSVKLSYGGGWQAALKLLYQTMIMTQNKLTNYEWFVTDIFEIVINIMKDLDEENPCYNELKMRIFYRYALYLNSRAQHFKRAIEYFYKAFELAKGETWPPDSMPEMERYKTMYEAIPHKLAKALLLQGKKVLSTNPEEALQMANEAVGVLSAVSFKQNKLLACRAILTRISFMVECHKFDLALSFIEKVMHFIIHDERREFQRLQCEIFLYKGLCQYNLNEMQQAMDSYRTGYILSRKFNSRDLQAEFLLSIGRAYGKSRHKLDAALEAYTAARKIFIARGDYQSKMKTTYLLAKVKSDQLFSQFMRLVKSTNYCEYYKLRQWKNQCKPFWRIEPEGLTKLVGFPSVISESMSVTSKKILLDDEGYLQSSDDDSIQDVGEQAGAESELNLGKYDLEYKAVARRSTDFFGIRESLKLKSSDWGESIFADIMQDLEDPDNLDCLLQEFESVESKL